MDAGRMFFACTVCLAFGFGAGWVAYPSLYGDGAEVVRPQAARPPPAECPPCPPPAGCAGEAIEAPAQALDPGWLQPLDEPVVPGLPLRAVQVAQRSVVTATEVCFESVPPDGAHAHLEVTVTATGGQAQVSEALVLGNSLRDPDLSTCLAASARRVRFAWDGDEGRATFKLVVP
jgi:hypothetical protein